MTTISNKKIIFLINLNSGGSKASKVYSDLIQYKHSNFKEGVEVCILDFKNLDLQIAESLKFETIVIGGGDGTFSSLMGKLKTHNRLGILPLGTANDLARYLGIESKVNLSQAKSIIDYYKNRSIKEFRIGSLTYNEHKHSFINYVSFGYDAKIVKDFSSIREISLFKKFRSTFINKLLYLACGIYNLRRVESNVTIIDVDNQKTTNIESYRSIIFSNIPRYAGFTDFSSESSPFDDRIEVSILSNMLNYFSLFTKFFAPVRLAPATSWKIKGKDLFLQIDGECLDVTSINEFNVIISDKINLIC